MRIALSDGTPEPGVVGILRPTLLWPSRLTSQLDDRQIAAVCAHELCHVRRRDNLTAVLQMGIQALFWFHPLVWWLGARMLQEREQACDEAVVLLGTEPATYAEALVRTSKASVASPLLCAAGVTGSHLSR